MLFQVSPTLSQYSEPDCYLDPWYPPKTLQHDAEPLSHPGRYYLRFQIMQYQPGLSIYSGLLSSSSPLRALVQPHLALITN